jgi:ribosomal protein S18 acetylase RimI-like enzyme
MEIKNLQNVEHEKIFDAFREAFLNYFVPFTSSYEETKSRWEHAGVNLKDSYAAFDEDKLVAFILNAPLDGKLYNFAMGVIPSHRGQHLIEKIFLNLPRHFSHYQLEVITENVKAMNLYKKIGYETKRQLDSFSGVLHLPDKKSQVFQYDVKDYAQTAETKNISLYHPSAESSSEALSKTKNYCETHELRIDGVLRAFAHFVPDTLSVKESGALSETDLDLLFHEMKLNGEKLRFMNIDHEAEFFQEYLLKRGMEKFISQYEMVFEVPSKCGSDNQ